MTTLTNKFAYDNLKKLEEGDGFMYEDDIYMLLDYDDYRGTFRCFNFTDLTTTYLEDDTEVMKVNLEVIVTKCTD